MGLGHQVSSEYLVTLFTKTVYGMSRVTSNVSCSCLGMVVTNIYNQLPC